jgi:hypothetical protein
LVASLASDGVGQDLLTFDAIEDTQIAVSELELGLPGWPPQAETILILNGCIIFAEGDTHRRRQPRAFGGAERLKLTNRVGAKLDGSLRQ